MISDRSTRHPRQTRVVYLISIPTQRRQGRNPSFISESMPYFATPIARVSRITTTFTSPG